MATLYPTALDTDNSLWLVKNGLQTTLSVDPGVGGVTINVNSTTGFPGQGYFAIDSEVILYTGLTPTAFTGCTRGADGTTAVGHAINGSVYGCVAADHHNALKDAVKALEAKVGINSGGSTGTSIDAAQLAASSSASIVALTTSGLITSAAGFRDSRADTGANVGARIQRIKKAVSTDTSFTFSAIPQGYNELELVIQGLANQAGNASVNLQFNGDSGNNYDEYAYAVHSNPPAMGILVENFATSVIVIGFIEGSTSGIPSLITCRIHNYSDTSWHKTVLARSQHEDAASAGNYNVDHGTGRWRNTAAITSLTIALGNGTVPFLTNSIATLYAW